MKLSQGSFYNPKINDIEIPKLNINNNNGNNNQSYHQSGTQIKSNEKDIHLH